MKPILEIKNISKKFRIHHEKQAYLNMRDSISSIFKKDNSSEEMFYALHKISFDVYPGQSIGIIGKNGAGKSTLLKILSKITPPSSGKIISRGRIASLLEVGTGFHSELSGRENIFLNGSILGMKRAEIQKNFDEIVDFSGVEKFLDTPLKHYSSGMQLRLAFAVAAFLENEILIIDEVLAVGDSEFQKKCIGKMEDVSNSGRTVLFVSHDLNAVQKLCANSLILDHGVILKHGKTSDVISEYIHGNISTNYWERTTDSKSEIFFKNVRITLKGKQPDLVVEVSFKIKSNKNAPPVLVAFNVSNQMGQYLGQAMPSLTPNVFNSETEYKCEINLHNIVPDEYYLGAWIGPNLYSTFDWQKEIVSFKIIDSPQESRVQYSTAFGMLFLDSKIIDLKS